jgi:hypothetical protein
VKTRKKEQKDRRTEKKGIQEDAYSWKKLSKGDFFFFLIFKGKRGGGQGGDCHCIM